MLGIHVASNRSEIPVCHRPPRSPPPGDGRGERPRSITNSLKSLVWTVLLMLLMIYSVGLCITQAVCSPRQHAAHRVRQVRACEETTEFLDHRCRLQVRQLADALRTANTGRSEHRSVSDAERHPGCFECSRPLPWSHASLPSCIANIILARRTRPHRMARTPTPSRDDQRGPLCRLLVLPCLRLLRQSLRSFQEWPCAAKPCRHLGSSRP